MRLIDVEKWAGWVWRGLANEMRYSSRDENYIRLLRGFGLALVVYIEEYDFSRLLRTTLTYDISSKWINFELVLCSDPLHPLFKFIHKRVARYSFQETWKSLGKWHQRLGATNRLRFPVPDALVEQWTEHRIWNLRKPFASKVETDAEFVSKNQIIRIRKRTCSVNGEKIRDEVIEIEIIPKVL